MTGIERRFDVARKLATLGDEAEEGDGPKKGEVQIGKALIEMKTEVLKTPKGLRRQRVNETRWNRK